MLGDGQARRVGPYLASTCRCCPGCAGAPQGARVQVWPQAPSCRSRTTHGPARAHKSPSSCYALSPPLDWKRMRRPHSCLEPQPELAACEPSATPSQAPYNMHGSSGDSVSECALAAGCRRECAALGARAHAGWPASPRPPACSRIGCRARLLTTPPAAAAARPTPRQCRGCHRRPWSRP